MLVHGASNLVYLSAWDLYPIEIKGHFQQSNSSDRAGGTPSCARLRERIKALTPANAMHPTNRDSRPRSLHLVHVRDILPRGLLNTLSSLHGDIS